MKHQEISTSKSSPTTFNRTAANFDAPQVSLEDNRKPGVGFGFGKRTSDILISIFLLPALIAMTLLLLVANRYGNRGPIFYAQTRMGKNCEPFRAVKFRSMKAVETIDRGANDPLEEDRITPLGRFLRKTRLDELPQIYNVLNGDMSLIGPRPDYYDHALYFLDQVPGYRERHSVRPGISGLAQIEVGYAANHDTTRRKVAADLRYIQDRCFRLEAKIFWQTILVIVRRGGM